MIIRGASAFLRWLLLGCVALYRGAISPWLGPRCRFEPTCSAYAGQVLREQPLPRALGLTLRRLLRCHPGSPGGFDPPPPAIRPPR